MEITCDTGNLHQCYYYRIDYSNLALQVSGSRKESFKLNDANKEEHVYAIAMYDNLR